MFTTTRNLTNLASADIIYGDGTFYTSTTQFTQLYTLHAMVYDVMYPLVFGLLPGKTEEIYDRYINLLKTTCQQHQPQLTPQTFFTDFKTSGERHRTWTRHRLQRQRQRPTIRKTNSSSTTGTSRRCTVQHTGRYRYRQDARNDPG